MGRQGSMVTKKDNRSGREKAILRHQIVGLMEDVPVICETHGGKGVLWGLVYKDIAGVTGFVFEKDWEKAKVLALQRPRWAVYSEDCVRCLAGGVGAHLTVNLLDVDPYGDPWPAVDAFFQSERPRAETLWIVVMDNLLDSCRTGRAWDTPSLKGIVADFGNDLAPIYADVVGRELIQRKAAQAGYSLGRFVGIRSGHSKRTALFGAQLTR